MSSTEMTEKWEVWKDEILIVMPVLRVYGIIVV